MWCDVSLPNNPPGPFGSHLIRNPYTLPALLAIVCLPKRNTHTADPTLPMLMVTNPDHEVTLAEGGTRALL